MTASAAHDTSWEPTRDETVLLGYGQQFSGADLRSLGRADPYQMADSDPYVAALGTAITPRTWDLLYGQAEPVRIGELVSFAPEPAAPSPAEVLTRIDVLRDLLDLTIENVGKLLGTSSRRYHDWRHGELMPPRRIEALLRAESVLSALMASEPETIRALVRDRLDEAGALIQSERYGTLGQLLAEVRAQRARELAALAPAPPFRIPESTSARALSATARSAEMGAILGLLESLAPWTRAASESWRAEKALDMEGALETIDAGDSADERWTFMALLDDPSLDDFHGRALEFLRNPQRSPADWEAFLDEEDERAFGQDDGFEPRGSIDEWSPDETGARPTERYPTFGELGIDLVTGRVTSGH